MAGNAERCVAALRRAKSDTEKFAALLLITKVVKAQDCDNESRREIFRAIGFDFINRLLHSDDVPEGCPVYIYKAIALTLLSCFCTETELITHPEMRAKASDFADLIVNSGQSTDEQMMINDALVCLSCVINTNVHDVNLCKSIVPKLCQIVANEKHGHEKCLILVNSLAQNMGSACWIDCLDSFHLLLDKLAKNFLYDNSEKKFELCQKLTFFILSCPTDQTSDRQWFSDIRKGLRDILFSKVSLPQMEPALKLASAMIEKFGVQWALSGTDTDKFFLILSHLTCIEVRMIVEDRSMDQVIEEKSLLTSCFVSMEHTIAFLVSNDREIEFDQKTQLYTALTSAMNGVLTFLSTQKQSIDDLNDSNDSKKEVLYACVRVIGAWLAEETSALRDEVYAILPFLIQVSVYAAGNLFTDNNELNNNGDLDLVRFLLPGLSHLIVEDKSRNVLIGVKFHELLYDYLVYTWKIFNAATTEKQIKAFKDVIITTCGIFMNITVLDADLVINDETFHKLLRFIFRALPELENKVQHLTVIGNLSVIGLLLLRHYAARVKSCESSIYNYLSSSIKFLWDAHNIEDSQDFNSVVITREYKRVWKEIMELWFLGMEALSTLLRELPWIGRFILESGWITVILQTLKKIQRGAIDDSTKSAYEHFLCCLVPTEKCIQQVFIKEGALEVCTTHNMKVLEEMLAE